MCNPIIFKCLACGLRHSYKPQPCPDARKAQSAAAVAAHGGFAGGAPLRLCVDADMREYNVSCDACKDAWNARQREVRRKEARHRRAASRSRSVDRTAAGRV